MGLDSMCGILPQTLIALLVIKEQISSTRDIYLHMFQLPKNQITLQYMHNHPHINTGNGVDQGGQPSSPPASWYILLLGSHLSFPQHLQVHWTAPAWKIMGPHPMMCTPSGHLGDTFLLNLHPIRIHHRCTTAISSNLKVQSISP